MAGILGAGWASGGIAALSLVTIPALLTSSLPGPVLARQWASVYNKGKALMPVVAGLSLVAFGFASYQSRQYGNRWKQYASAAGLTIAIVPFTLGLMSGVNGQLMSQAAGAVGAADATTAHDTLELLKKWSTLNLTRSLWPLLGAAIGLWTLVGQ